jgi:hypothetical protein
MTFGFKIASTPLRNILVCGVFLLVLCLFRYMETWHGWAYTSMTFACVFLATFYLAVVWANRNLFRSKLGGVADWVIRGMVSAVILPFYIVLVAFLAALFSVAIGGGFFDAIHRPLVGPYILIAVDSDEQLSVGYDLGNGCSIGRIGSVVTDVGWNSDYIVATVRPPEKPGASPSYYYLDIKRDSKWGGVQAVTGPLSLTDYERAKRNLNLPDFTRSFPQLR